MIIKMKKGLLVITMILSLLYMAAFEAGFTGLIIPLSKYQSHDRHLAKGDKVYPLKEFDFDSGSWEVYLSINPEEDFANLSPLINKSIGLMTTDKALLKRAQKTWRFTYTGSDAATITSAIYFVRNGELVFESGIQINKALEGLQSQEFGWIEPDEKYAISDIVKDFDRVYWPVVLL